MSTRTDIVSRNSSTADIDAGLKNRWKWDWLKEVFNGDKFCHFFEKLKIAGKAYCKVCRCEISYKSGGKRALFDHLKGKQHNDKVKTSNENFRLSESTHGTPLKIDKKMITPPNKAAEVRSEFRTSKDCKENEDRPPSPKRARTDDAIPLDLLNIDISDSPTDAACITTNNSRDINGMEVSAGRTSVDVLGEKCQLNVCNDMNVKNIAYNKFKGTVIYNIEKDNRQGDVTHNYGDVTYNYNRPTSSNSFSAAQPAAEIVQLKDQNYLMQDFLQCLITSGRWPGLVSEMKQFCSDRNVPVQTLVNMTNKEGKSFLHVACESGSVQDVTDLLENQSNVSVTDHKGRTPLYIACLHGRVDIVKLLLEKKALTDTKMSDGKTSLHASIESGNTDLVLILLKTFSSFSTEEEIANFVSAVDNRGFSALHLAAARGWTGMVKTLLENGASVKMITRTGATPLFLACLNGNFEAMKCLLEHKAEEDKENLDGTTPLHAACIGHHDKFQIVKCLLEKNVSAGRREKKKGWMALHYSAENGNTESVELLARHNPDGVSQMSFEGVTPLHLSCRCGHIDVTEILLREKAKINVKDCRGATPLHYAAANGHKGAVQLLLKYGALETARTHKGDLPVDLAYTYGHEQVVDTLVGCGNMPSVSFSSVG